MFSFGTMYRFNYLFKSPSQGNSSIDYFHYTFNYIYSNNSIAISCYSELKVPFIEVDGGEYCDPSFNGRIINCEYPRFGTVCLYCSRNFISLTKGTRFSLRKTKPRFFKLSSSGQPMTNYLSIQ
jgi:hypothetical protein